MASCTYVRRYGGFLPDGLNFGEKLVQHRFVSGGYAIGNIEERAVGLPGRPPLSDCLRLISTELDVISKWCSARPLEGKTEWQPSAVEDITLERTSGNKRRLLVIISASILVFSVYIYGESLNDSRSPENQTLAKLERYLSEFGESDRIIYATCYRFEETENDPIPNVSFFVGCEVKDPPFSKPVILTAAFGLRGQVEFWDVSRGEK